MTYCELLTLALNSTAPYRLREDLSTRAFRVIDYRRHFLG